MRTVSEDDVRGWAAALEHAPAGDVLAWAAETFSPRIGLATGFGAEGCVLVHLIAERQLPIDLFTLDTGLLFPETYELWRRLECRYGIRIRAVTPAQSVEAQARSHGDALWARDPDRCCSLRKIEPLHAELRALDAWVTAIRRDQTAARAGTPVVGYDSRFALVKVNPLVRWTRDDVWRFIREHDVPFNPLHERGYPSIGCEPCTTAVAEGEDPRAGRWRGTEKTECGLHGPGAGRHPVRWVSAKEPPAQLFPAFLKLAGRPVLVVGAGPVAASKIAGLLATGARVTVVAPEVRPEIEQAPVRVLKRAFHASDLDEAWLVVAAATPEVNREVAREAEARRVFVNAVDDPPNATAYLGGVLRRDGVTVAISTDGKAPALAGLLREGLDALLPPDLDRWMSASTSARRQWLADNVPMAERRPLLLEALNEIYESKRELVSAGEAR